FAEEELYAGAGHPLRPEPWAGAGSRPRADEPPDPYPCATRRAAWDQLPGRFPGTVQEATAARKRPIRAELGSVPADRGRSPLLCDRRSLALPEGRHRSAS